MILRVMMLSGNAIFKPKIHKGIYFSNGLELRSRMRKLVDMHMDVKQQALR